MKKKRPHQVVAAAFLMIGSLLVYMAFDGCLLWIWPASNCLWVGAAYFGVGGRAFGKREDGSLNPWTVFVLLPFLLINWATWAVQSFFSNEAVVDEVAPGLWLGRRVFDAQVPENVSLIIDMTAEFANPGYSVSYLTVPTLDAFIPEEKPFLAAVERAAKQTGGILVYCANGHGRSAMTAGAILIKKGLAGSPDEAEAMIVKARPRSAWHPAQRALLERLFRND